MFLISYHCISIILMKTKQGFMFRVLLFFTRIAGKELVKVSLEVPCVGHAASWVKHQIQVTQWKLEICEMETSVKWIVERWKGDGWSYQEGWWSKGYGKRKGSGNGTCWRITWVAEACGCPGHPAGLGRAVCSGATSCREKPSDTNSRARKVRWASRQAASLRLPWRPDSDSVCRLPHFLLGGWKLSSWFL